MQERRDEEAAEGERAGREGMSAQQEHGRQREEDRLRSRSALTTSREGKRADRDEPPERPDDAEREYRPDCGPVLDDFEDTLLLRGCELSRASHGQPGRYPRDGV